MDSGLRSIHFVGICGTAMAAVAAALKDRGIAVTGSDEGVYPPMSDFLAEREIRAHPAYAEANLAHQPDLVVIGNALSRGNPEVEAVLERRLRHCSLPELLKTLFLRGRRSVVVAGTHGKTTTTALLAWTLEHAGRNPSFLIGGIPKNFNQGARFTDSEWFVIEGDEYDTAFFDKRSKFVHYAPEIAILNNLEFDHADIFRDLESVQTSFRHFINLVPRNGLLLANGDDPNLAPLLGVKFCPVNRFGFGAPNDVRAEEVVERDEAVEFRVGGVRFRVPLPGEFNARNALAAVACARHCGLTDAAIQAAFESFAGVKRRMEIRGVADGVTVIDDFAHHPTAIAATLRAVRRRWPGARVWALFEPRSNTTRRSVFQHELATALAHASVALIAPVARLGLLRPEERLDPERLVKSLEASGTTAAHLPDVDTIVRRVVEGAAPGDVVCVLSNGGFGGIHDKLLRALELRAAAATSGA